MAKPIRHVMIDLETLSVESNAAVIQAGIVFTTDAGNLAEFEYTCSPTQYRDRLPAFHVDQNTINFHHKENPENFQRCVKSQNTLKEFAYSIYRAIETAQENRKYTIWLWCNGTDFDLPILRNLFKHTRLKPNWSYPNVRDYRTLRDLHKETVPKDYKNDHSALGDARNQYEHLMQILNYMERE